MPEVPRTTRQLTVLRTVALAFTLAAGLAAPGFAQSPAAKAGAGIFPLTAIWTVAVDTLPGSPAPVYDEGQAYLLVAGDAGASAKLAAFSLGDGTLRWSREIARVDQMAAGDGLVVTCAGSTLEVFAAADGEPRWQLMLPAPPSAPLHYAGGWLIVVTQGSDALAIRADDGGKVWQRHLPSPATGEPALDGDGLYLPLTDNRVIRLKLDTGALVWDRRILAQPTALLALADRVFVGTAQWFYALEQEDGKVRWRQRVGASVIGRPAADQAAVYFLALDNLLRAVDRSGGTLKWRRMLTHREQNGPTLVGDVALVSGRSATVQAYGAVRGAPAGSYDAPDDLAAPVHVARGLLASDFVVVVLTAEGQLVALRPRSLQPEAFSLSPRTYLITGFPIWRW